MFSIYELAMTCNSTCFRIFIPARATSKTHPMKSKIFRAMHIAMVDADTAIAVEKQGAVFQIALTSSHSLLLLNNCEAVWNEVNFDLDHIHSFVKG